MHGQRGGLCFAAGGLTLARELRGFQPGSGNIGEKFGICVHPGQNCVGSYAPLLGVIEPVDIADAAAVAKSAAPGN